jgi:hypothetical protein
MCFFFGLYFHDYLQLSTLKQVFLKSITTFKMSRSDNRTICRTCEVNSNLQIKSFLLLNESKTIPTIARVLYLFLCENQFEVEEYSGVLPSITADVMFFCWKESCDYTEFKQFDTFYVSPWSRSLSKHQPFVRFEPEVTYTKVRSRVFIINEKGLQLTSNTTWTTARNLLLKSALIEERRQGWRWAYFNFGDGDIQIDCSLAETLLETGKIDRDKVVFAQHYRFLANNLDPDERCFVFIDTFLLIVSPAIGVLGGVIIPNIYDDLLAQIVYHIDGMFNAFHRDVIPFVLPYCSRYDERSWLTSQKILVYRSLCFYGHVIQFNVVRTINKEHRAYPRNGDPWLIDGDMNLVPSSLIPLQTYMNQSRVISPLVLQHYDGWSLEMINDDCRQRHTYMDPLTCKVSGD